MHPLVNKKLRWFIESIYDNPYECLSQEEQNQINNIFALKYLKKIPSDKFINELINNLESHLKINELYNSKFKTK